jgi:hypothetical protein
MLFYTFMFNFCLLLCYSNFVIVIKHTYVIEIILI